LKAKRDSDKAGKETPAGAEIAKNKAFKETPTKRAKVETRREQRAGVIAVVRASARCDTGHHRAL